MVVFLASDYAGDVNGQFFLCAGGAVALVSLPRPVKTIFKPSGDWTLDELDRLVPTTRAGGLVTTRRRRRRPERWATRLEGQGRRSSPARAAASAAASRCCSRAEGAAVVVNDLGGERRRQRGVRRASPTRSSPRSRPRAAARSPTTTASPTSRRGAHHRHRGAGVRRHRHPGQQRRHPARPHALQPERGRLGRGDRGAPEGHLQLHAPRRGAHARAAPRAHHHHVVDVGRVRQLRPGELRRREGRHRRADARRRARSRQVRHHRQRRLPRARAPA